MSKLSSGRTGRPARPEGSSSSPWRHDRRMIQALSLSFSSIRHAFFTREGGVSEGIYQSLNGGIGSNDAPDKVRENRARMAAALGVTPANLVSCYQIHSPNVVVVERAW